MTVDDVADANMRPMRGRRIDYADRVFMIEFLAIGLDSRHSSRQFTAYPSTSRSYRKLLAEDRARQRGIPADQVAEYAAHELSQR